MKTIRRALRAEWLKSRRTLGTWLVFLAPLVLGFLELVAGYQYGERMYRDPDEAWLILADHTLMMWFLLLLPLFVTLQMGLLGALEHNNKTWKQLYALPLPRWGVYAAKQIIGLVQIGVSTVLLVGVIYLVGQFIHTGNPELGFANPIPWSRIICEALLGYLASWLIIAIHLWVSLHFSSFVFAMSSGIAATVAGILVISSEKAQYYPWTMPGLAGMNYAQGDPYLVPVILGLAGGILVSLLGGWETARNDVL